MDRVFYNTILVQAPSWIGDAVMSLPALMDLRECFPHAELVMLANPTVAELLRGQSGLDDIVVYERASVHKGVSGMWRLRRMLKDRAFDMAVLFQNAFRAALLVKVAQIPVRVGYDTDGRRWLLSHAISRSLGVVCHQIDYYQRLVQVVTNTPPKQRLPKLVVPADQPDVHQERFPDVFASMDTLWVGINPGSVYGSAKRWLLDRFAELGDQLVGKIRQIFPQRFNVRCLLIGGKGEESLGNAIARRMSSNPLVLSGKTTIGDLLRIIQRCAVLVTNDTGPMHVAHALGVPVVGIFGSTDPWKTSPGKADRSVVRANVRCSPCLLRACPIDHRCMTMISTEEVMAETISRLQESLRPLESSEQTG